MLLLSLWMLFLGTLHSITCSSPENQCNWRGSGLSLEPKSVEQVSLQCAEGTVEWLYPTGAIRLSLVPRQSLASPGPLPSRFTACIKPAASFRGAQLYLEKEGVLELLLSEGAPAMLSRVHCFSWQPHQKVALFLQATPQLDISRRISAFRYELRGDWDGRLALPLTKMSIEGACSPCNDTEILMAVCTSDFVVRGNIRRVVNDAELQESVIGISATRVHRQKFTLFQPRGHSVKSLGDIRTPLSCGVKLGPGSFLFMGWVHFGDAWLGCAPRYKDFKRVYEAATHLRENPCEILLD
ncbi:meteorin isoform X1 [Pseudophryne corroboree]|uniref:meteorin isoform X1 n=1 Tax=Pseudophryne corroboree TaxID=495146 RepID=UPI00308127B9